jgi:hypothetical protein
LLAVKESGFRVEMMQEQFTGMVVEVVRLFRRRSVLLPSWVGGQSSLRPWNPSE